MNIENLGDPKNVAKLHESSNFDYKLPEFEGSPLFPIQRAVTKDGRLICAAVVKVEAEVYLWMDHHYGTPEERWEAVKAIHADLKEHGAKIGFDSFYCVLPPEVSKSFGPRLEDLGWKKSRGWDRYTLEVR